MLSRRSFLQGVVMATSGIASGIVVPQARAETSEWFMPDEGATHKRTWMGFIASSAIWGDDDLPDAILENLALIAKTIRSFEPVTMLVRSSDLEYAQELCVPSIDFVEAQMNDFWLRDIGPVFVTNKKGEKAGIDFNFNGWGNKQEHDLDTKIASFVNKKVGVPTLKSSLVWEGGGIEVDGKGTAIITESCLINSNRNPGLNKKECEQELKRILGVSKIIWLPGIIGMDITDGHTDFYARFVAPGVVVAGYDPDPQSFDHKVTQEHLKILQSATDAQGRALQVNVLQGPTRIRSRYENDEFAAGYINYYVCNGGIVMPEFGDRKADAAAKQLLQKLYPSRKVVAINIDAIASGGGGIHCTTQQEIT